MTTQAQKRTRHVFPTREVAHIWSRRTQHDGRNARGNFYFEGDTIYSYGSHFPIARFVNDSTVLFTTSGYSNTTAKHIGLVRRALPNYLTVINVDNIRADSKQAHEHNIELLWQRLVAKAETHQRARVYTFGREAVQRQIMNLQAYTQYAKLGRTKKLARLCDNIKSPHVWGLVLGLRLDEAAEHDRDIDARRVEVERKGAEKRAAAAKREAERLAVEAPLIEAAWRAGQSYAQIPASGTEDQRTIYVHSYTYRLPVMLRLSADKERVETSHGATISVETAKRIWPLLKARAVPAHIEDYRTIGWHSDDTFQVGCHRVPYSEMVLIANELGLE